MKWYNYKSVCIVPILWTNLTLRHFHFITQDKKNGGHLLNVCAKNISVKLDKKTSFKMILPEEEKFQQFQLSEDMSKDIHEVETK